MSSANYEKFKESVKNVADTFQKASEISLQKRKLKVKDDPDWRSKYPRHYKGQMVECVKPIGKCPSKHNSQFILSSCGSVRVFCLAEVPCWRKTK